MKNQVQFCDQDIPDKVSFGGNPLERKCQAKKYLKTWWEKTIQLSKNQQVISLKRKINSNPRIIHTQKQIIMSPKFPVNFPTNSPETLLWSHQRHGRKTALHKQKERLSKILCERLVNIYPSSHGVGFGFQIGKTDGNNAVYLSQKQQPVWLSPEKGSQLVSLQKALFGQACSGPVHTGCVRAFAHKFARKFYI